MKDITKESDQSQSEHKTLKVKLEQAEKDKLKQSELFSFQEEKISKMQLTPKEIRIELESKTKEQEKLHREVLERESYSKLYNQDDTANDINAVMDVIFQLYILAICRAPCRI